jgi:hypothetical protein
LRPTERKRAKGIFFFNHEWTRMNTDYETGMRRSGVSAERRHFGMRQEAEPRRFSNVY